MKLTSRVIKRRAERLLDLLVEFGLPPERRNAVIEVQTIENILKVVAYRCEEMRIVTLNGQPIRDEFFFDLLKD